MGSVYGVLFWPENFGLHNKLRKLNIENDIPLPEIRYLGKAHELLKDHEGANYFAVRICGPFIYPFSAQYYETQIKAFFYEAQIFGLTRSITFEYCIKYLPY